MVELSLKVNRSQQQHSAAGNPVTLPSLHSRRVEDGSYDYISYYKFQCILSTYCTSLRNIHLSLYLLINKQSA